MSTMTRRQKAALANLTKTLDRCHAAGLTGGVYEYQFRVWPIGAKPDPRDSGWRFFEMVEEIGGSTLSKMTMDGGAGV